MNCPKYIKILDITPEAKIIFIYIREHNVKTTIFNDPCEYLSQCPKNIK